MSNTLLSIRTDEETKKEIMEFANSVGLSVSALVTTVLRQTMQEGKVVLIPDLKPSPYLERTIKKAKADLEAGLATPELTKAEAQDHLRGLIKK